MFNKFFILFYFLENRVFCEIMWKHFVEPDRTHMTKWRVRIACWIPKVKNTLSTNQLHGAESFLRS